MSVQWWLVSHPKIQDCWVLIVNLRVVYAPNVIGVRNGAVWDAVRPQLEKDGFTCKYEDPPIERDQIDTVQVPNAKTRAAMREARRGGLRSTKDVPSLLAELNDESSTTAQELEQARRTVWHRDFTAIVIALSTGALAYGTECARGIAALAAGIADDMQQLRDERISMQEELSHRAKRYDFYDPKGIIHAGDVTAGAFQRYVNILAKLCLARSERELTMQEEYVFTCDLESLWSELTEAERKQIEKLTDLWKLRTSRKGSAS